MSIKRTSLALAATTVAAFSLCAVDALAQEPVPAQSMQPEPPSAMTTTTTTQTPATTTTTQAPTTTTQAPVQQPPVQSVTVQQPAQPASTTTTTAAPYAPQPVGAERERTITHRPNKTLLSTGAGIFILSYGASAIAGGVSDRDSDKRLFIPLVGPWMDLADRNCTVRACGGNEDVAKAMIVTSGIVQGAGVLLALGSLVIPESTTYTETTTAKAAPPKPKVQVAPVSFLAGAGLGAIGTF